MKAAKRISLRKAGWTAKHKAAWDTIREALMKTICSSYRDRRMRACLFSDASRDGWAYAITQCDEGELDKPWEEQKHELLAVNSGKFRNSQKDWGMPCKEAYPVRRAVERHRHLLMGNLPFSSVNDHRSLKHVFDEPARAEVVSVAARGRLRRWAEYLRSFTFDTVHIPGEVNHLCDLLSRNGCTRTATMWKKAKHETSNENRERHVDATGVEPLHKQAGGSIPPNDESLTNVKAEPQMAIIEPAAVQSGIQSGHKDMDVTGDDLLPIVDVDDWPDAARIAAAQREASIITEETDSSLATPLQVTPNGRVVIPQEHQITKEIIAICHQGDMVHRSAVGTWELFNRHYYIHGLSRKQQQEHIKGACKKCLSCIKTRTGKVIPRPMWYMVRATKPFEYIHLDYIELPDAANGMKYVLVITDDLSLTTVLHATKNNDAETVVKVLLEHWFAYYPDCDLMHTDGGSHFDNAVVKLLAQARGWKHTICTPYAKWAHGVAERNNRVMLDILSPLCRRLKIEDKQWPSILKLV